MNPRMWRSDAVQANVELVRARGVELLGPEQGDTAEGELGVGRMSEPEAIFESVAAALERREQLRGRRVLGTAGARRGRRTRAGPGGPARRGPLPWHPPLRPHGRGGGGRGPPARGGSDARRL